MLGAVQWTVHSLTSSPAGFWLQGIERTQCLHYQYLLHYIVHAIDVFTDAWAVIQREVSEAEVVPQRIGPCVSCATFLPRSSCLPISNCGSQPSHPATSNLVIHVSLSFFFLLLHLRLSYRPPPTSTSLEHFQLLERSTSVVPS
jgi:hypothetical protein